MLVKLTPDQIGKHWKTIKDSIEFSLNPTVGESSEKMNNILMALLSGELDCWLKVKNDVVVAVVTTRILYDSITDMNSLLIYSIYAEHTTEDDWLQSYSTLRKYGQSKGCTRIVGYTDNSGMIKLANRLGAEARYTLISIPTNMEA